MRRVAALAIGERIAIDIGGHWQGAGLDRVFSRGDRRAAAYRCIVDRADGDRHGVGIAAALAVIDGVGEAVGAVIVGGRCVDIAAVRVDGDRAMRRVAALAVGQRIAIDVGGHREGAGLDRVFAGDNACAAAHRCIIDRRDRDRYRVGIAATFAIIDGIGEAVGAVVVGRWRVRVATISVDYHCAMSRIGRLVVGKGIAIDIGGGWQSACLDGVFHCGYGIIACHRRIVDGTDGDRYRVRIAAAIAVADGIGKAVRAVVVGHRRIGVGTVGVDHHRAMRRVAAFAIGDGVTIDIGGGWQGADLDGIFRRGDGIIACHRCIVDRADRDRHGVGIAAAIAITDGVGKAVGAVVVGHRRIGVGAVGVDYHRAVRRVTAFAICNGIAIDVRCHWQRAGLDGVFSRGNRRGRCRWCIVDRTDLDHGRVGVRTTFVIADGVSEAVGAVIVGRRVVGVRTISLDCHCAMCRIGCLGVGKDIAVEVCRHRQGTCLDRVFAGDDRRVDGDRHRVGIRAAIAIADRVGKTIRAAVVGHRRVGIGAVGIDHHSSVRGIGRLGVGDGIAIDIGGSRQAARLDHVFSRRDRRGRCRWRIVDRVDGNRHGVGIAAAIAVAHTVGKAVGAVVVGHRCIGIGAVGVDHYRAVRRVTAFAIGNGIAIDIRCHWQRAGLDGVFSRGNRRGRCRWCIVDRTDLDHGRVGVRTTFVIADGVSEAVGAVIVGRRVVGVRTISLDCHCAMCRIGCLGVGKDIAVEICRHRQGTCLDRVFAGDDRRVDGDRHRVGIRAAIAIADGIGKAVGAVVIGHGSIGISTVGVDHHRAVRRVAGLAVSDSIAIDIGSGWQSTCLDRVFSGGDHGTGGGRCIVDRADRDRHRVRIAAAIAIADGVGKAVAAVVVGHRRIGVGAVGVDHHRAMRRVAAFVVGDGVAIDVGGRWQATGLGGIFRRDDRRAGGNRLVVDGRDVDRNRIGVRSAVTVRYVVGEAVAAIVVRRRNIQIAAVVVDNHPAMRGSTSRAVDERVTFQVRGRRQSAGLDGVFGRGDGIIAGRWRIVDRADRDGDRIGVAAAMNVAHRIGKAVSAVVVGDRRIGVGTVGIHHHRAVGRVAAFAVGDGIAIDIRGRWQAARLDRVFGRGDGGAGGGRRIVDRADGNRHRVRIAAAIAVAHRVGKAVGAVIVGHRRIGVGAVGIHHHRAVRRVAAFAVGDGIAIDIRGRWQAARLDRVFGRGDGGAGGGRRIVDRADGNRHRVGIAAAIAIADGIGKAVGAVIVGHRRIGVGAVGIHHHRAVRRVAAFAVGDGIAIDIRGSWQATGLDGIFCRRNRCAGSGWRIVDRADDNRHRVGIAAAIAVAHRVGKAVGAVVVGHRRIGVGAVGIHHHCAMGRVAAFAIGDGVAIDIGGGRQAARFGRVFGGGNRGAGGGRCIVDRADGNRHRVGIAAAIAIADGIGKAVGAVVVGHRRIGVGAVAVDYHSAVGRIAALAIGDGIAIDVGSRWQAARFGRVFGGGNRGAGGGRCIVDRADGNRHRVGIAAAIAIADGIGKAVGAVVVGHRRIGVGAVAVDYHSAVGRIAALAVGDGIAIDIGGGRQAARLGRVFGGGNGSTRSGRRIVDRADGDRHSVGVAAALAVADGVSKAVGAVVVGGRRIGVGTVGVDHHRAMRRVAALAVGDGIAIEVGRGRQRAGLAGIFRRRDGGARCRRRIIGGGVGKVDHDIGARGAGDRAGRHAAEGAIAEADAEVADVIRIGVRAGVAGEFQGGGGGAGTRDFRRQAGRGIGKRHAGQRRAITAAEAAVGQGDGRRHRKRTVIGGRFGEVGGAVFDIGRRGLNFVGVTLPVRTYTEVKCKICSAIKGSRPYRIAARFNLERTHRIIINLDAIGITCNRARRIIKTACCYILERDRTVGLGGGYEL